MYCDLWPYVWLINESGFKSRAAYGGARTVFVLILYTAPACKKQQQIFDIQNSKFRHVQIDELLRTLDFNKFTGPAEGAKIRGCPLFFSLNVWI